MFVKVKELPRVLQDALVGVGYAKSDVNLCASESYAMNAGGSSDGRRAFVVAIDLATGKKERRDGSWGGPNMFNPGNGVDLDDQSRPLPPNFAVIHGSIGGGTSVHEILLNPVSLTPLLPTEVEISKVDSAVLKMYCGLTSAGRKNQIERWIQDAAYAADSRHQDRAAVTECRCLIDEAIERLIARGLLSRNRAGAVAVTTAGKNARVRKPGEGVPGGYGWWPGKVEKLCACGRVLPLPGQTKCADCQDAEREARTDLCDACKVQHHDVCLMTDGCSCCDDTRRKLLEEKS